MNIYLCKRGEESWSGALIIYAENENDAQKIFAKYESDNDCRMPFSIKIIDLKRGVIYNDDMR